MNKFYEMCRDFLCGKSECVTNVDTLSIVSKNEKFYIMQGEFSLFIIERDKEYSDYEAQTLTNIFDKIFES